MGAAPDATPAPSAGTTPSFADLPARSTPSCPCDSDRWCLTTTRSLRLLSPRAIELAGRLVHVREHEQMTLRLYGPRRSAAGPAPGPAPGTDPAVGARLGPGARYLAARNRLLRTALAPELDPVRPLLHELVADERIQRHATPPLLVSVYHLVRRDRRARYGLRFARPPLGSHRCVSR